MDLLKGFSVSKRLATTLSVAAVSVGLLALFGLGYSKAVAANSTESAHEVSEELRNWMNRQPANASAVSGSVQARKRYPGGADEDDLQVQATLPSPNRGLEAQEAISAPTQAPAASD